MISFSGRYIHHTPSSFPTANIIIAPYWDDIDMRHTGLGLYTALTSTTGHNALLQVDNFLVTHVNAQFTSIMLIVAQWRNVCPYGNSRCSTGEVCL